jgi:NTE family protein
MANEVDEDKPKHLTKEKVHYLAFEGGGGKGVAYLGAIEVLENYYKILPIKQVELVKGFKIVDKNKVLPGSKQIKGVSGSSAGAITALMLSLGLTANEIKTELKDNAEKFGNFLDAPKPGIHRIYHNGEIRTTLGLINRDSLVQKYQKNRTLIKTLDFFTSAIQPWLGSQEIITKIYQNKLNFLTSLILDGGLFIGENAHSYFSGLLNKYLPLFPICPPKPELIDFKTFHRVTKVDLRITGTNVYRNRPYYFSSSHTPTFPVSLAVEISMNLPILFKPIIVDSLIAVNKANNVFSEEYKGLWVDGGLLNNLPIHAFDNLISANSHPKDKSLFCLNDNIIAIRLMDGFKRMDEIKKISNFNYNTVFNTTLIQQLSYLNKVMFYPMEEGQIRTPLEESRTIRLYTENLELTNFTPSDGISQAPIEKARIATRDYFGDL